MATTQETVLKLKTTTARLKTKVTEHEGLIIEHAEKLEELAKKLETNDGENLEEFREEIRESLKQQLHTMETVLAVKLSDKLSDKITAKFEEKFAELSATTPQEPIGKIKMLNTKPTPTPTKSWMSWSLLVVLSSVFLLLGLWIGAVTAPAPVGYVGMSESGAKLILAPVDADSADPTDMMWKHGSTRFDPITGKQLRLNVQNWEVVETPKPGRKPNSPSRIFVGPKGDTIDTQNLW